MKFYSIKYNSRIYDDYLYNHQLNYLTKFNKINNLSKTNLNKITLNFGFKGIKFEKKKNGIVFYGNGVIN